jgi:phenylacetate-CoA ligase
MSYDPQFQQRIFEMLQQSQYWPEQQMRGFQEQQLAQLLTFARENVPFYKDRLAKALTADGKVNWECWLEIPIVTREDLLNYREQMLAPLLPPGHGYVEDHLGSGTTGRPVTSRHNSLVPLVSEAALYRALKWHNITFDKIFCHYDGEDPKIASWPEGLEKGSWGPDWLKEGKRGKVLQINRTTTPEQVAEFLLRKKVDYFSARPNLLHSIALAAKQLDLKIRLSGILTVGSDVSELLREDCRKIFGAEIIGLYASKEVYNIAHQCPSGEHYHTNPELNLIEILDDLGRPCVSGQRGRIVVTNFFNTAQPFIRYVQGDEVVMGGKCTCGRALPVIQKVVGRTTHLFRLPENRKIALSLPAKFMKMISARSWQIAQVKPLQFEVRYISDNSDENPDFDSLTDLLRSRIDHNIDVTYVMIEKLPLTYSGKFIEYVCELPPES